MAKKTQEEDTQPTQAAGPIQGESAEHPAYTMGRWGEFPMWKCRFCPYDTLQGEANILEHVASVHAPPEPVQQPKFIQAYDRYGNPIE